MTVASGDIGMARHASERGGRPGRAATRPARPIGRRVPRRWLILGGGLVLAAILAATISLMRGPTTGGAIATLQTNDFHALAFSPTDPNIVYFGHHNGVMRSDDGGRTWRQLVERRSFDAMGLALSPAEPRRIYLAGHDLFQVSTDGGAAWQPVTHNLPGTDIHGFAMSLDDPNRLYALVVGHGILRSTDGGRTWQPLDGQVPSDVMALAAAGGTPETLYAGSMRAGLLRSGDGGQSWAPTASGPRSQSVLALAVDSTSRQTVYAGAGAGLYKSTDGGATWSKLPYPGSSVVALAVSPAQPNVVLAIAVKDRQGLVYRSEDGGATWGERR